MTTTSRATRFVDLARIRAEHSRELVLSFPAEMFSSAVFVAAAAPDLLVTRYDRVLALLDARAPTKVTSHKLQADPECLLWNPHNPAQVGIWSLPRVLLLLEKSGC